MAQQSMEQKLEYTLLQFSQPNTAVWDSITMFVSEWNQTHLIKFQTNQLFEYSIYFSSIDIKLIQILETELTNKTESHGWVWVKTKPQNMAKETIESHGFVQIIGDGYPDEFIYNSGVVLEPISPCTECGTEHPHLRAQTASFIVNEEFLSNPIKPNTNHSSVGLDLVNTPNGGLLVSEVVTNLLTNNTEIQGYQLIEVLNKNNGVSSKLFQLMAKTIVLTSKNYTSQDICPKCGTVLEAMGKPFSLQFEGNEKLQIFSRAPGGFSSIYVSNTIYKLLKKSRIRGLTPVMGVNFDRK